MAENSKIAWTDHTFNPWIGCTKVSDGCKFCYAEELMDKRYGKVKWGPQGERVRTAKANWRKPVQWNKVQWWECTCGWRGEMPSEDYGATCPACSTTEELKQTRQRVFCASLADVFEDNPQVENWREDLFDLIDATPNLDWLLLTKRPEFVFPWMETSPRFETYDSLPKNVWLGTTVENQESLGRVEHFGGIPSRGPQWLSVEPMIGPVDLTKPAYKNDAPAIEYVDWVICGGESGAKCRPMDLQWARDLRDQCKAANVPFFMKQLGGYPDKRDQMSDFPEDLQIREFPA